MVFIPNTGKYGPVKKSAFEHFSRSALFWAGKVSWNMTTSINNLSIAHGRRPRMEKMGSFFSKTLFKQHFKWEMWPIRGDLPPSPLLVESLFPFVANSRSFFRLKLLTRGVNTFLIFGEAKLLIGLKSCVWKIQLMVFVGLIFVKTSANELVLSSKIPISEHSCILFIMLLDILEQNIQISGQ